MSVTGRWVLRGSQLHVYDVYDSDEAAPELFIGPPDQRAVDFLRRFPKVDRSPGSQQGLTEIDQPLDTQVADICADGRRWIARLESAHDVRALRDAYEFLRRVSVAAAARISGLTPHDLDVLAGCLQGVESALLRAERRITTRRRGMPSQYLGLRRRLGTRLRVPDHR